MNDIQMKQFIELAKCLNFTRAAKNLYIAQPALSRSIAKIENELGVTLFKRDKKNVRLTPSGIVLMHGFMKILKDYDNILKDAREAQLADVDSLNIGIIECLDTHKYLQRIFEYFKNNHPKIKINIYYNSFDKLRDKLNSGEMDVIITQLFDLVSYKNDEIIYKAFADTNGGCIVSNKHVLAKNNEISANDLNGETAIIISELVSRQGHDFAKNYLKYNNIKLGGVRTAFTLQDIMLQVEAGLGFAFWSSNSNINKDYVKFLKVKDYEQILSLAVVWRKENYNLAVMTFINGLLRTDNYQLK